MKKFIKYQLTEREKELLTKCHEEVAVGCNCDCKGCPFKMQYNGECILERLKEIVDESEDED